MSPVAQFQFDQLILLMGLQKETSMFFSMIKF